MLSKNMAFEFDDDYTKILYNLGKAMIYDDKADLGYTTYYGRKSHKYNGRYSPNHPSPLHHWQAGSILVLLSQFLSLNNIAKDAMAIAQEDDEIVDDNIMKDDKQS